MNKTNFEYLFVAIILQSIPRLLLFPLAGVLIVWGIYA